MVMQQPHGSGQHLDSPPGARRAVPWGSACSPGDTAAVAEPPCPSTECPGVLVIVGAQAAEGMGWKARAVGGSVGAGPPQHLLHRAQRQPSPPRGLPTREALP